MKQKKARASPLKKDTDDGKEQVPREREVVLRAHDLIFTANGIIPKYIRQWR